MTCTLIGLGILALFVLASVIGEFLGKRAAITMTEKELRDYEIELDEKNR